MLLVTKNNKNLLDESFDDSFKKVFLDKEFICVITPFHFDKGEI